VISKVRHRKDQDWDLHSGGVPNLTRSIEKKWMRELTWQTVDLNAASVEDLLESPVLFFSGQQTLQLTAQQKKNLRTARAATEKPLTRHFVS
jgi:hypothetical protein